MSVSLIGKDLTNIATESNGVPVFIGDAATPEGVGAVRMFSENDTGDVTGTPILKSPETDDDYRLRTSSEVMLDAETFNYAAQNTGKHIYRSTTMANAWTANGLQVNSGSITTINTGTLLQTYGYFPLHGAQSTYCTMSAGFNVSTFPTNTTLDFGMFLAASTVPFAPTDGVFFRVDSTGMVGVINFNGTQTFTPTFVTEPAGPNWTPVIGEKYSFLITINESNVEFWIDNVIYGTITVPLSQGQPFQSASLPMGIRQAIGGVAASAAMQFLLSDVTISIGGPTYSDRLSVIGNRIYGSYQALSGSTPMGSLATLPNSTNPTAAAPSNTALTANLPAGLGGQGVATAAAAAATDLIFGSFQVPPGTVAVQGRRLVIRAVMVDAVNTGAIVATNPTTIQWSLAFGHTAAPLNTAEAATTKAPRRVSLGFMTWPVGAAIGAQSQTGRIFADFGDAAAFVNPGEFVALVGKFLLGSATPSQTITYVWQPVFGWE